MIIFYKLLHKYDRGLGFCTKRYPPLNLIPRPRGPPPAAQGGQGGVLAKPGFQPCYLSPGHWIRHGR